MFSKTNAANRTQTLASRARYLVLGGVALASLLTGCAGEMDVGASSESAVSQPVTGAATSKSQSFPLSETGAVVIDDGADGFSLDPTEGYHGMTRSTEAWEKASGFQGGALTAPSGSVSRPGFGAAALVQWSTTATKGSVDVYTYVTPSRGLTTWAVYCIFNQLATEPTCTHLDQSNGEARWVWLGKVEATGAIQVVLDTAASPADGSAVQADAVAFVPA